MSDIFADNINQSFVDGAYYILRNGKKTAPRGKSTIEVLSTTIEISDATESIITLRERKPPYLFMCGELLWILSGSDDLWIADYLSEWSKYKNVDENGRDYLNGAYGKRIRYRFGIDQLDYVIKKLKEDPDSRQAVILIYDSSIDTIPGKKDIPCTVHLQFMIRDGKLDGFATMRSNDFWRGYSTDAFNFCSIQNIIASILGVPTGRYFHHVKSLHIYEEDIPKFDKIFDYPHDSINSWIPPLSTMDYNSLDEIYADASFGKELKSSRKLPDNDRWLTRLMKAVLNRIDAKEAAKSVEK